jgi:hypothetical protein
MTVKMRFRGQLWMCSLCGAKSDKSYALCFPVEAKP